LNPANLRQSRARLNAGGAIQGFARSGAEIAIIVLTPVGRRAAELEVLARLIHDQARRIIAMNELTASRSFRQKQASASGARLAAEQRALTAFANESAVLHKG